MPRRLAVFLTSPHSISGSSHFVVLDHQIEPHLLPFQLFAHSVAKTPGWHQERFFNSSTSAPSALLFRNSFRSNTYRRTPRFAAFWPKLSVHKSFGCDTYRRSRCNPFRRNTYKKCGEGDGYLYWNCFWKAANWARRSASSARRVESSDSSWLMRSVVADAGVDVAADALEG